MKLAEIIGSHLQGHDALDLGLGGRGYPVRIGLVLRLRGLQNAIDLTHLIVLRFHCVGHYGSLPFISTFIAIIHHSPIQRNKRDAP
jgi:hypothetical protein